MKQFLKTSLERFGHRFDGDGKNMFAPVLFLELQEMLVSR